ncbi:MULTISPECIES: hypothetical protein [unclassified Brachybacterium]|uniref:hypothetical protein n=1 Tax=unclassified Brachybacterium TaxID=2623841 RepID=UPI0040344F8C
MDLERGIVGGTDGVLGRPAESPEMIGPDLTTPLLRRCTALAARARVDLLSGGRHDACDELEHLLVTIDAWDRSGIVDPDPTMVVLAAAALQDLGERLPASVACALGMRITVVLDLLHTLMDSRRIDALA